VLILDEPTSSLDLAEVQQLFKVIRKLKSEGIGILFVTHFIDQVYEITDSITVLRNGRFVGEYETEKLARLDLIAHMLGKRPEEFREEQVQHVDKNERQINGDGELLRVEDVERKGSMNPFTLSVRKGEILGLAGLLGSGRTETARLLFGIDRSSHGRIFFKDEEVTLTSPRKAIDFKFGFCPEDRKKEGLVTDLSVRENIILALQARTGIFKPLSKKQQEDVADRYIELLRIKTPSRAQAVKNLSGGNQQKVVVSKWLATHPSILIMDEPTRGIDVGSKGQIYSLLNKLADSGMGILMISSEIPEILEMSDRILIMSGGEITAELPHQEATQDTILHYATLKTAE
jgi:simple sugar transport system ATP-binding protein